MSSQQSGKLADDTDKEKSLVLADEPAEPEWIRAAEAYSKVADALQDPVRAGGILAQHLRNGKVRARAKGIWISDEPSVVTAWKSGPKLKRTPIDVPVSHWRSSKAWVDDQASWIWSRSRFHLTLDVEPPRRRMIRRTDVALEDLKAVLPNVFGKPPRKRGNGPQPDIVRRTLVWKVILELALSGDLKEVWAKRPQKELEDHIYDGLHDPKGKTMVCEDIVKEVIRQARPLFAQKV